MIESYILFLIAGIILLLLEVFVVPGFGICGLGGVAALTVAIYQIGGGGAESWYYLLYLYIVLGVLFFIILWLLPRHMSKNPLVLKQRQMTGDKAAALPMDAEKMLGKEGVTLSELRPAGKVLVEKQKLDVVTSGEFIERDVKVRVVAAEGSRIVVEKI